MSNETTLHTLDVTPVVARPDSPILTALDQEIIPTATYSVANKVTRTIAGLAKLPAPLKGFTSALAAYSSYSAVQHTSLTLSNLWGAIKSNPVKSTLVGLAVAGAGVATGAATTAVTAVASLPGVATSLLSNPLVLLNLIGQSEISAQTLECTQDYKLSALPTALAQAVVISAMEQNPVVCVVVGAEKVVNAAVEGLQTANTYFNENEEDLRSSFDMLAGYNP